MSRIADADGALWPITGHRCPVCRMPADPVLDGEPHPFCLPRRQATAEEHAAALRLLADALGPVTEVRPLDVWIGSGLPVAGAALPTPPSTAGPDPILAAIATAGSDAELTELWRQQRQHWTDTHTAAVLARLREIGAR